MFSHPYKAGLIAAITATVTLTGSLAGCASAPEEEEVSTSQAAAPEISVPRTRTAIEAAGNTAGVPTPHVASTQDLLRPDAPKEYTVKRGDTLWAIAGAFLKDPWTWPEIWYANPDIKNPHLIYPGDVLVLARGADGRPRITLSPTSQASTLRLHPELRADPLDTAVPTIPYAAIAAFLARPSLLAREEIKNAPYVLGFDDEHQAAGADYVVYARGLKDAPVGARYSVVHVGQAIVDPDDGKTLGYEGIYTGTAVVQRPAKITKTRLVDSARETLSGDPMLPDSATTPLNFTPHAPEHPMKGQIVALVDGTGDGTDTIGQYDIVAINRGGRDGVGPGTVLAIDEAGYLGEDHGVNMGPGTSLRDRIRLSRNVFNNTVRLPGERAGTLLVFKSYDRMSYALVVGASRQMRVLDVVHNP